MSKWLQDALQRYSGKKPARYHVPGHKGRNIAALPFGDRLFAYDVTELSDTDDAHQPRKCIMQAQQAAAYTFGAQQTIFLTNGATAGVMAMLAAVSREGTVIIGRDCHKSAVNALALFNARVHIIEPAERVSHIFLPEVVGAESVRSALQKCPEATAVFITSPNYYGCCADLFEISRICKAHGVLLLVDQSHGAHLRFVSPDMPCASNAAADIWVDSAHKTLCALTQSAYLHFGAQGQRYETHVRQAIAMLQSSSPSFPLLCGLEGCADVMAKSGPLLYRKLVQRRAKLEAFIERIPGLSLPQKTWADALGQRRVDPARLVIAVQGKRLGGIQAQQSLNYMGVVVEMADLIHVVLLLSPWDPEDYDARLMEALGRLPKAGWAGAAPSAHWAYETRMTMRQALDAQFEMIPLGDALGRVATQPIGPVPPGNAVIWPGEAYTRTCIEYLQTLMDAEIPIFGMDPQRRVAAVT